MIAAHLGRALVFLLAASTLPRTAPAQSDHAAGSPPVAGTYEIQVCRGVCAPGALLARGLLVLEAEPRPMAAGVQLYFYVNAFSLLLHEGKVVDPNACFVLRREPGARTYAGATPVGMTRWEADGTGAATVRLFQGAGAGYVATLRAAGDGLRGQGRSWGASDGAAGLTLDSIRAVRVGPPSRFPCIQAAEAAVAPPRGLVRPRPPLLDPVASHAPAPAAARVPARRMDAFLAAVRRKKPDSIAAFFPRRGTFTFARTRYERRGRREGTWLFPGADAFTAIRAGGPLHEAFSLNPHGHPIGPFFHQVVLREGTWRRVGGNRFVPPGASPSSPIFVEWQREGDAWVVAAFGDEIYGAGVPLPPWCC